MIIIMGILLCVLFCISVVISAKVDNKTRDLSRLIQELKEQLDIQEAHQEHIAKRIVDLSQKHNNLATVFEEHGHGLLDEDTMQPMAHSTTPVSLVGLLQRMMSQAKVTGKTDLH